MTSNYHRWKGLYDKNKNLEQQYQAEISTLKFNFNNKLSEARQQLQAKSYMGIRDLKENIKNLEKKLEEANGHIALYKKWPLAKRARKKDQPLLKQPNIKTKRGKQPGSIGHGRKKLELPVKEQVIELHGYQTQCPCCYRHYQPMNATDDSEVVEISVSAYKRVIKRMKYTKHPECTCPNRPEIIKVPKAAKCINKGKLGASIYTNLLVGKFGYQVPIYRLLKQSSQYGIDLSQGTVTDGFKKILSLLEPIYNYITSYCQQKNDWHVDETGWKVFKKVTGKKNYNWYL